MYKMFRLSMLLMAGCLLSATTNAQKNGPAIEWQKTFGGDNHEYVHSVIQTTDGGYIVLGTSLSGISGDKTDDNIGQSDLWIIKLNDKGDITWSKTIGGIIMDFGTSIVQLSDGGYVVSAIITGPVSAYREFPTKGLFDMWLFKLDAQGNMLWQNNFGEYASSVNSCTMIATKDGGFLLGSTFTLGNGTPPPGAKGDKTEPSRGGSDVWLVKTNAAGQLEWDKTYGGTNNEYLSNLCQTDDGGYLVGTSSLSGLTSGDKSEDNHSEYPDYWILKLNNKGAKEWDRTIGGKGEEFLTTPVSSYASNNGEIGLTYNFGNGEGMLQQTSDGNYVIGGYSGVGSGSGVTGDRTDTTRGVYDYWIVMLDKTGKVLWDKALGGDDWEIFTTGRQTPDGGFIIGGNSRSGISGDKTQAIRGKEDIWIVKLDKDRKIQWDKTLGGSEDDILRIVRPTRDGGYIVGGYSYSGISGDKTGANRGEDDYWIIKLAPCNNASVSAKKICKGTAYDFNGTMLASAGEYNATLRNMNGCDSLVNLHLEYYNPNKPVITASEKVLGSGTYQSYQWFLNGARIDGAVSKTYTAPKSGLYKVAVTSAEGCKDTSAQFELLLDHGLFVPNLFSPNYDSKNDELKVYGNNLASVYLQIFNQWGQKIYESHDMNKGWDGGGNGKDQPAGVYIYVVEAKQQDGTVLRQKGSVTLIR